MLNMIFNLTQHAKTSNIASLMQIVDPESKFHRLHAKLQTFLKSEFVVEMHDIAQHQQYYLSNSHYSSQEHFNEHA